MLHEVLPALVDLRAEAAVPGARSRCRFINRGTEYISESGVKRMRGRTERQYDRALAVPVLEAAVVPRDALEPAAVRVGVREVEDALRAVARREVIRAPRCIFTRRFPIEDMQGNRGA